MLAKPPKQLKITREDGTHFISALGIRDCAENT